MEKLRCCCCSPGPRQLRCTRLQGSEPQQWWFAHSKALGEQLSSSSRKLVEAALEAGAWGDAVVVLEGGKPGISLAVPQEASRGLVIVKRVQPFGLGFLCKLSILLFSFF